MTILYLELNSVNDINYLTNVYKRLNKLVLLVHGKAHLTCIARSGDGAVVPGHVIICLQMLMQCKQNKGRKCRNTGCLGTEC
jgi:hypothetical protein